MIGALMWNGSTATRCPLLVLFWLAIGKSQEFLKLLRFCDSDIVNTPDPLRGLLYGLAMTKSISKILVDFQSQLVSRMNRAAEHTETDRLFESLRKHLTLVCLFFNPE